MDDLCRVLDKFPRTFTIAMAAEQLDWPMQRARQAIVNGQQADVIMALKEVRGPDGMPTHTVYENRQWRKQWLTNDWGISDEWRKLAG